MSKSQEWKYNITRLVAILAILNFNSFFSWIQSRLHWRKERAFYSQTLTHWICNSFLSHTLLYGGVIDAVPSIPEQSLVSNCSIFLKWSWKKLRSGADNPWLNYDSFCRYPYSLKKHVPISITPIPFHSIPLTTKVMLSLRKTCPLQSKRPTNYYECNWCYFRGREQEQRREIES